MTGTDDVSRAGARSPIHFSTVLIVEGRDAWGFFLTLVQTLGLQDRVEVRNGGGIGQLLDYLAVLRVIENFDKVVSLGIVCDTEANPDATFARLQSALTAAGLSSPRAPLIPTSLGQPPSVAVALLPDASTPGMLETLLWRSLVQDPRASCINQFLDCVRQETGVPVKREDKSRIRSYLATREQPGLLLGQAARANYFPFESAVFDELKGFLRGLVESDGGSRD